MNVIQISKEEFRELTQLYTPLFSSNERAWFKSTIVEILGTLILDPFDKDWSYVILAKNTSGAYEAIDTKINFLNSDEAIEALVEKMIQIEADGIEN